MVIRNFKKLTDKIVKVTGDRSPKYRKHLEDNFKKHIFNGKQLMSYSIKKNKKGGYNVELDWK